MFRQLGTNRIITTRHNISCFLHNDGQEHTLQKHDSQSLALILCMLWAKLGGLASSSIRLLTKENKCKATNGYLKIFPTICTCPPCCPLALFVYILCFLLCHCLLCDPNDDGRHHLDSHTHQVYSTLEADSQKAQDRLCNAREILLLSEMLEA